jgi:hypothetical protein
VRQYARSNYEKNQVTFESIRKLLMTYRPRILRGEPRVGELEYDQEGDDVHAGLANHADGDGTAKEGRRGARRGQIFERRGLRAEEKERCYREPHEGHLRISL